MSDEASTAPRAAITVKTGGVAAATAAKPINLTRRADVPVAVTSDMVEQYLAVEHKRNIKALRWVSSILLLLIVCISALAVIGGLKLADRARRAEEKAKQVEEVTRQDLERHGKTIETVAENAKSADEKAGNAINAVTEEKDRYRKDRRSLRMDLEGLNKWYDAKYGFLNESISSLSDMAAKIDGIEKQDLERKQQFEEIAARIREEAVRLERAIETMKQQAAGGASAAAQVPVGAAPVPVGAAPVPAPGPAAQEAVKTTETIEYPNGNKYEGEVLDGKKNGKGTFFFVNGDRYVGDFENDLREGQGTYFYREGHRYEGGFKAGRRNGRGVYRFINGDVFRGMFSNDKRNGPGVYSYADGSRVEGEWRDDVLVSSK